MKKSSFTLVELLVVIGIIGILAGMIMPALGGARASGVRTNCINNRHQMGLAILQYANDNNQAVPFQLSKYGSSTNSVSNANYAQVLSGKKGKASKGAEDTLIVGVNSYLPSDKSLVCTEADKDFLYTDGTNAAGMLDLRTSDSWYKGKVDTIGRFRSSKNNCIVYYLPRMKDPANLVLFADTFKVGETNPNTYCWFTPSAASGDGRVTTVHMKTAVVGMADGSSQAMFKEELKDSSVELTTVQSGDDL